MVSTCYNVKVRPSTVPFVTRVNYYFKYPTQRKISSRNDITSMQIFVTDENNEILNFNGLSFEV